MSANADSRSCPVFSEASRFGPAGSVSFSNHVISINSECSDSEENASVSAFGHGAPVGRDGTKSTSISAVPVEGHRDFLFPRFRIDADFVSETCVCHTLKRAPICVRVRSESFDLTIEWATQGKDSVGVPMICVRRHLYVLDLAPERSQGCSTILSDFRSSAAAKAANASCNGKRWLTRSLRSTTPAFTRSAAWRQSAVEHAVVPVTISSL